MNSFTDIRVLECNRLNSEEAKSSNNENLGLWHNKLGDGVLVMPGDKISVEQSFISEEGAGDSVIEFKGQNLGATHTINYLTPSKENACSSIPEGYEKISYNASSEVINLVDNKASIVINYYKSMNGENYVQLPRKFNVLDSLYNGNNASKHLIWNTQEGSNYMGGLSAIYGGAGGLPNHQVPYFYRDARTFYYCDADYAYRSGNIRSFDPNSLSTKDYYKLRNDGNKYTMFVRDNSYFLPFGAQANASSGWSNAPDGVIVLSSIRGGILPEMRMLSASYTDANNIRVVSFNKTNGNLKLNKNVTLAVGTPLTFDFPDSVTAPASYWIKEPSDANYLEYTERIDLSVGAGFNSPSNVANDLTNQLNETGNFTKINYDRFLNTPDFTPETAISGFIESQTYKIFNAMCLGSMTDATYLAFNGSNASNQKPLQTTLDWLNAHQFIGIKRPDLFTYGRDVTTNLQYNKNEAITRTETYATALGTLTSNLSGFNPDLYTNDVLGSASPAQIGGGAGIAFSGNGLGQNGGFLSNAAPVATPRHILFTGSNTRFFRTKNITDVIQRGGKITVYWIKGNSNNGGERADAGENLELRIQNSALGPVSTTVIALGGGVDYPNNIFSEFTYNLTAADIATGAHISLYQTSSSQSTFDVYGVKHLSITTSEPDDNGPAIKTQLTMAENPEFINTNILFNKTNLLLLKGLFDIQALYPELFINPYNQYGNGDLDFEDEQERGSTNVTTNRFLHINPYLRDYDGASLTQLGTDDISASGAQFNSQKQNYISLPLYFIWQSINALKGPSQLDGTDPDNLTYGFAYKKTIDNNDYISFKVGTGKGNFQPPYDYFDYNACSTHIGNGTSPGLDKIQAGTLLGWDRHWTAYSTCAIGLIDGHMAFPYKSIKVNTSAQHNPEWEDLWGIGQNAVWDDASGIAASPASILEQMKKVYMGANSPLIDFDTVSGRFNIQDLHTPEYIGNDFRAGQTPSIADSEPVDANADANVKCYKINKRITQTNFTPAMMPYSTNYVTSASGTVYYDLALMNYNFDPFCVMDAKSGITIKDFGFSEGKWNDGLWGILGFSYNQFNTPLSASFNSTSRVTETNVNKLNFATTNADITSGQSINFITNEWGVQMYNQQIPAPAFWNGASHNTSTTNVSVGTRIGFPIQNYPPITEVQNSIKLTGINLPRKMLRPYYCIRSDIIDMAHYLGGEDSGQALPVCAIVNKINGYGDFYFSSGDPLVFTATAKKMITSITTSIHSPDQTYARVNSDSCVIYKIIKQQPASFNILEQIQQENKKK